MGKWYKLYSCVYGALSVRRKMLKRDIWDKLIEFIGIKKAEHFCSAWGF